MSLDLNQFQEEMHWLWRAKPSLAEKLETIAGLCEMELGRQAQRLQEAQAMIEPMDARIVQLSTYIDKLILKNYGPGEYQLDGETWYTGELK